MALVNCPECGREVSDRATACPHCGNPLRAGPTAARAAPTEEKKPWYQQRIGAGGGCLVLIALGVILSLFSSGDSDTAGTGTPPPVDLSAAVRFSGTQFIITNSDVFNWSNCKLEINSGIVRGGYELRTSQIESRSSYTVGAMQFAKSSGERFNPLGLKPNNFSIACDTPTGRGYYFAEWQ